MPTAASPEPDTLKHEKKSKKDKLSKHEKKRAREEDIAVDGERKHKKSKSISAHAIAPDDGLVDSQETKKEKNKSKKDGKPKRGDDAADQEDAAAPINEKSKKKRKKCKDEEDSVQMDEIPHINSGTSKSEKKEKKTKKKKNKKKDAETTSDDVKPEATLVEPENHDGDAMDVDEPSAAAPSGIYQPPDIPDNPQFPFFKQTVSLYEAVYPSGWAQPVTTAQNHHLQQLRNRYVPEMGGFLLDYANVSLGHEPGRRGAAADDESPTTLLSKGEYAVGFGWITADVELFVPTRGAWMEGSVNLQTEGHIGVVCFGKFNASIEATRLPPSWRWVSNESPEANGFEETASVITEDDHGVVRQIHSTGFWVDGSGTRIKGKVRFRIRNFDAGTNGENSYLSLEGTMLDRASEKKLVQEEARLAQVRREKKGGRKNQRRWAPGLSMTRFASGEGKNREDAAVAVS